MFQYEKDTNKVGTASDYGKQLMIGIPTHKNITRSNNFDEKNLLQDECLKLTRSCTRLNVTMEQPLATICRYLRSSISNKNNTKNYGQVDGDGDYLLVLKMSEVYFNAPNMKVFDVVLNGDLTVSSDLDIFEKVRLRKDGKHT